MNQLIVRIHGGLGNQLFQYAAGRAIASELNMELKLDAQSYIRQSSRDYELGAFSITGTVLSAEETDKFWRQNRCRSLIHRVGEWIPFWPTWRQVTEPSPGYHPNLFFGKKALYLNGYWQSEKYFMNCAETILREFYFRVEAEPEVQHWIDYVSQSDSVAIHVRRGDYYSNPELARIVGPFPDYFYRKAVAQIASLVGNPRFFVFSDDLQWVENNLDLGRDVVYVRSTPTMKPLDDFRIMTHCHNFIFSNSSYAWWAAWLCTDKTKTVMHPALWVRDARYHNPDLLPINWIRIDC